MRTAISRACVRRPVATIMVTGIALLLGALGFSRVPITLMPGLPAPGLTVEVEYPGVTPDKIEEVLTKPLESALSTVGGVEELYSTSEEGKSRINMRFEPSVSVDIQALEVREKVDLVAATFPSEVRPPAILRYDPDQRPVIIVALESRRLELMEIRDVATQTIKRRLAGVRGVSEVYVAGGRDRELLIDADRTRLEAHQLTLRDVMTTLQGSNLGASAGKVRNQALELPVVVDGRLREVKDFRDLTLFATPQTSAIRLGDVAEVRFELREQDSAARVDGKERVSLYIHRTGDSSILRLSADVREKLEEMDVADLSYEVVYDQAETVRDVFGSLVMVSLLGLLVTTLVLLIRESSPRILFYPWMLFGSAILPTFFVMFVVGIPLTALSWFGLATGAALAVFTGFWYLESSARGVVIKSSFVIISLMIVVATPLVYSSRETRTLYGGFTFTMVVSLFCGWLLIQSFLPVLLRYLPRRYPARVAALGRRWKMFFTRANERFALGRAFGWPRRTARDIGRSLELAALGSRFRFFLIFFGPALLGITAFFFMRAELYSSLEQNQVNVRIEMPSGTGFDATNEIALKVEKKLRSLKEVERVSSRIESASATLLVRLKGSLVADAPTLQHLRGLIGTHEPAFVYLSGEGDTSMLREVVVDVMGEDLIQLDKLTKEYSGKVKKMPGFKDVVLRYKAPRPELQIIIDKAKAERVGLSTLVIGQHLRYAIQGGIATKLVTANREVDVRVRYRKTFRSRPEDIEGIQLKNEAEFYIPLKEVSRQVKLAVPVKIYRRAKKRMLSFSFRPEILDPAAIIEKLDSVRFPLPEGYRIEYGREFEGIVKARRRLWFLITLAVLFAFMFLAALHESFKRPLRVTLPACGPAGVAVLTAFVAGASLTIPVLMSLLLVVSVAVALSSAWSESASESARGASRAKTREPRAGLVWFTLFFVPWLVMSGAAGAIVWEAVWVLIAGVSAAVTFVPMYYRVKHMRDNPPEASQRAAAGS